MGALYTEDFILNRRVGNIGTHFLFYFYFIGEKCQNGKGQPLGLLNLNRSGLNPSSYLVSSVNADELLTISELLQREMW